MLSRTAIRSTRLVLRAPIRGHISSIRCNSTSSTPTSTTPAAKQGASSGAIAGGVIGGLVTLTIGYAWYHFSGAKTLVQTANSAKHHFSQITGSMKDKAPESSEALKWLRSTTTSYAAFIPGAKKYVDGAFDDLDAIHDKHGDKVNKIVSSAYSEISAATQDDSSMADKAQKTWAILEKHLKELGDLASDSAYEILDKHPEVKKKVGGNIDQLKAMGDKYGPEGKKLVDDTWNQISDIMKSGVSADSVEKVRKLVEEKTEAVKKLGDGLWNKGMEQAKPYLDKSPEVKEMVEKNQDALKQGNVAQLFAAIKESVNSQNTDALEKYIKEATEKTKSSGIGQELQKYAKMIPGGDEILPKLSQLQEVAKKHGDEAEKILKDTYKEVAEVLSKRIDQTEKLADKAKKDAKK